MTKISTRKTQELKEGIYPSTKPTRSASQKFHKKNHKNQRKNSIHPSTHKTASARSPNSHNKKTRELKG
jgi:hypothetical protein